MVEEKKEKPKKISRRDLERLNAQQADVIEGILKDNAKIGKFTDDMITVVKTVHRLATEQKELLHLTVGMGKLQKRAELIRKLLGPFCVEVSAEDLKKMAEGEKVALPEGETPKEDTDADSNRGKG